MDAQTTEFAPPRDWFYEPAEWLDSTWEAGLIQIGTGVDDGRVVALVAPYGECILDGTRDCWQAPQSPTEYEFAHVGAVTSLEGDTIRVANIGGGVNHYDPSRATAMKAAVDHYANTASRLLIGRYHDRPDLGGIVFLGAMWPGTSDTDRMLVRSSALSGDWRWVESLGGYDMAGSQLVNVPGFRPSRRYVTVPRLASMSFAVTACPMDGDDAMWGMWTDAEHKQWRPDQVDEIRHRLAQIEEMLATILLQSMHDDDLDGDDYAFTAAPRALRNKVRRVDIPDVPAVGDDWRYDYRDPGTGKFAPLGYVSPGVLRKLLSPDANDRFEAQQALRAKFDSPNAQGYLATYLREVGNEGRRLEVARDFRRAIIGERPSGIGAFHWRDTKPWDAASDLLAYELDRRAKMQVAATPNRIVTPVRGVFRNDGKPQERKIAKPGLKRTIYPAVVDAPLDVLGVPIQPEPRTYVLASNGDQGLVWTLNGEPVDFRGTGLPDPNLVHDLDAEWEAIQDYLNLYGEGLYNYPGAERDRDEFVRNTLAERANWILPDGAVIGYPTVTDQVVNQWIKDRRSQEQGKEVTLDVPERMTNEVLWDSESNRYVDPDGTPIDAARLQELGFDPQGFDVPAWMPEWTPDVEESDALATTPPPAPQDRYQEILNQSNLSPSGRPYVMWRKAILDDGSEEWALYVGPSDGDQVGALYRQGDAVTVRTKAGKETDMELGESLGDGLFRVPSKDKKEPKPVAPQTKRPLPDDAQSDAAWTVKRESGLGVQLKITNSTYNTGITTIEQEWEDTLTLDDGRRIDIIGLGTVVKANASLDGSTLQGRPESMVVSLTVRDADGNVIGQYEVFENDLEKLGYRTSLESAREAARDYALMKAGQPGPSEATIAARLKHDLDYLSTLDKEGRTVTGVVGPDDLRILGRDKYPDGPGRTAVDSGRFAVRLRSESTSTGKSARLIVEFGVYGDDGTWFPIYAPKARTRKGGLMSEGSLRGRSRYWAKPGLAVELPDFDEAGGLPKPSRESIPEATPDIPSMSEEPEMWESAGEHAAEILDQERRRDGWLTEISRLEQAGEPTGGAEEELAAVEAYLTRLRESSNPMVERLLTNWRDGTDGDVLAATGPDLTSEASLRFAPAMTDPGVIFGEFTGGPQGSNTARPSGFWTGTDGQARYVKAYNNPEQAFSEMLSNRLYDQLGVGAPRTSMSEWTDPDSGQRKFVVVTDIVDNEGTVGSLGLDRDIATQIVAGFAADLWLANFDSVGMGLDNVVRTPDGRIVRIDSGGSLRFRAQGALKNPDYLRTVDVDAMYNLNPYYADVLRRAGFDSPADAIDGLLANQVPAIQALVDGLGGPDGLAQSLWEEVQGDAERLGLNVPARPEIDEYARILSERLDGLMDIADITREADDLEYGSLDREGRMVNIDDVVTIDGERFTVTEVFDRQIELSDGRVVEAADVTLVEGDDVSTLGNSKAERLLIPEEGFTAGDLFTMPEGTEFEIGGKTYRSMGDGKFLTDNPYGGTLKVGVSNVLFDQRNAPFGDVRDKDVDAAKVWAETTLTDLPGDADLVDVTVTPSGESMMVIAVTVKDGTGNAYFAITVDASGEVVHKTNVAGESPSSRKAASAAKKVLVKQYNRSVLDDTPVEIPVNPAGEMTGSRETEDVRHLLVSRNLNARIGDRILLRPDTVLDDAVMIGRYDLDAFDSGDGLIDRYRNNDRRWSPPIINVSEQDGVVTYLFGNATTWTRDRNRDGLYGQMVVERPTVEDRTPYPSEEVLWGADNDPRTLKAASSAEVREAAQRLGTVRTAVLDAGRMRLVGIGDVLEVGYKNEEFGFFYTTGKNGKRRKVLIRWDRLGTSSEVADDNGRFATADSLADLVNNGGPQRLRVRDGRLWYLGLEAGSYVDVEPEGGPFGQVKGIVRINGRKYQVRWDRFDAVDPDGPSGIDETPVDPDEIPARISMLQERFDGLNPLDPQGVFFSADDLQALALWKFRDDRGAQADIEAGEPRIEFRTQVVRDSSGVTYVTSVVFGIESPKGGFRQIGIRNVESSDADAAERKRLAGDLVADGVAVRTGRREIRNGKWGSTVWDSETPDEPTPPDPGPITGADIGGPTSKIVGGWKKNYIALVQGGDLTAGKFDREFVKGGAKVRKADGSETVNGVDATGRLIAEFSLPTAPGLYEQQWVTKIGSDYQRNRNYWLVAPDGSVTRVNVGDPAGDDLRRRYQDAVNDGSVDAFWRSLGDTAGTPEAPGAPGTPDVPETPPAPEVPEAPPAPKVPDSRTKALADMTVDELRADYNDLKKRVNSLDPIADKPARDALTRMLAETADEIRSRPDLHSSNRKLYAENADKAWGSIGGRAADVDGAVNDRDFEAILIGDRVGWAGSTWTITDITDPDGVPQVALSAEDGRTVTIDASEVSIRDGARVTAPTVGGVEGSFADGDVPDVPGSEEVPAFAARLAKTDGGYLVLLPDGTSKEVAEKSGSLWVYRKSDGSWDAKFQKTKPKTTFYESVSSWSDVDRRRIAGDADALRTIVDSPAMRARAANRLIAAWDQAGQQPPKAATVLKKQLNALGFPKHDPASGPVDTPSVEGLRKGTFATREDLLAEVAYLQEIADRNRFSTLVDPIAELRFNRIEQRVTAALDAIDARIAAGDFDTWAAVARSSLYLATLRSKIQNPTGRDTENRQRVEVTGWIDRLRADDSWTESASAVGIPGTIDNLRQQVTQASTVPSPTNLSSVAGTIAHLDLLLASVDEFHAGLSDDDRFEAVLNLLYLNRPDERAVFDALGTEFIRSEFDVVPIENFHSAAEDAILKIDYRQSTERAGAFRTALLDSDFSGLTIDEGAEAIDVLFRDVYGSEWTVEPDRSLTVVKGLWADPAFDDSTFGVDQDTMRKIADSWSLGHWVRIKKADGERGQTGPGRFAADKEESTRAGLSPYTWLQKGLSSKPEQIEYFDPILQEMLTNPVMAAQLESFGAPTYVHFSKGTGGAWAWFMPSTSVIGLSVSRDKSNVATSEEYREAVLKEVDATPDLNANVAVALPALGIATDGLNPSEDIRLLNEVPINRRYVDAIIGSLGAASLYTSWFTHNSGHTSEDVIRHEYGHLVHDALKRSGARMDLWAEFQRVAGSRPGLRKEISGYATKDYDELFAETYLIVTHPRFADRIGYSDDAEELFRLMQEMIAPVPSAVPEVGVTPAAA
jgi:hypothetical protein